VVGNDISTPVLITVEVSDQNGLDDIYRVTVDLSSIGGDSNQKMYDNGKFGDHRGADGIYSYEYIVPEALDEGTKSLEITLQDQVLNSIHYDLRFDIQDTDKKDDGTSSFLPGFQLDIFFISLAGFIIYLSMRKTWKI
jgi:hypothetical protein